MYTEPENTAPLLKSIPGTCRDLGGITRPTVYRLIDAGELERVKIGTRAFITTASLNAYVERRLQASAAELAECDGDDEA